MDPILRDIPDSFETERLLIRSPLPGDGPQLHAAVNESLRGLEPWMDWTHHHATVEGSEVSSRKGRVHYLERSDLRMHVYLKESGTFVGSSGLHRIDWAVPKVEIGYWLRTSGIGRGYMTEAVVGITDFAFREIGAKRVEIRCDPQNVRSARVAERAGFVLEAELRDEGVNPDGGVRNTLVYAAFPNDWSGPTTR